MDQYSPAELSELFLLAQTSIDTQFQYWITITFAVVAAAFAAGERLTQRLRYVVVALYSLATFTLFMRALSTGEDARVILQTLAESGSLIFGIDLTVAVSRPLVFVMGTIAANYFLLASRKRVAQGT
jgi:hypothetical protein